jgi:glycosyltransferase involved in cell wall biosynthesis
VRVLHVVPTYLPAWRHGGPVAAVHGLCKALAARGHQVTVFTTDVHGAGTLDVPRAAPVLVDGVAVWYFPVAAPRRLYRSPAMSAALAPGRAAPPGSMRRERSGPAEGERSGPAAGERIGPAEGKPGVAAFDLVHLHSVFLWPTAAAARAAERAGVPYLVAPRGMLVGDLLRRRGRLRKRLWIRLVERRTLARAAGLHATSELEAVELARLGLPLPPVYVVANGVGAEPWEPARESELSPAVRAALARRPLLLFLGRVSWKKGLDRLVAALADVPGATLAIAGNDEEGYRARLDALAAQSGVADRVVHLGPVHGAGKAALLAGADALVLPSYSENFGNVVLEAMAAGLPVVVTPEVGLAAVVREHGAGVVTAGDPPHLAAALRELLAAPEARAAMGRRGAAAADRDFSWTSVAARMEEVYEHVLAGRGGQGGGSGPDSRSGRRDPEGQNRHGDPDGRSGHGSTYGEVGRSPDGRSGHGGSEDQGGRSGRVVETGPGGRTGRGEPGDPEPAPAAPAQAARGSGGA